MKELDKFKEEINQKFTEIPPKMPNVDSGEKSKNFDGLTKIVQNMSDKFAKDIDPWKDIRQKYLKWITV